MGNQSPSNRTLDIWVYRQLMNVETNFHVEIFYEGNSMKFCKKNK